MGAGFSGSCPLPGAFSSCLNNTERSEATEIVPDRRDSFMMKVVACLGAAVGDVQPMLLRMENSSRPRGTLYSPNQRRGERPEMKRSVESAVARGSDARRKDVISKAGPPATSAFVMKPTGTPAGSASSDLFPRTFAVAEFPKEHSKAPEVVHSNPWLEKHSLLQPHILPLRKSSRNSMTVRSGVTARPSAVVAIQIVDSGLQIPMLITVS